MYKKTILYILLGLGLFLVLDNNLALVLIYKEGFIYVDDKPVKYALISPPESKIWGLGSSHFNLGLEPYEFEKESGKTMLNAAQVYKGYVSCLYTFKELLVKSDKPELILVEMSIMSLDYEFLTNNLLRSDYVYLSYPNRLDYHLRYAPISDLKYLSNLYLYRYYSRLSITRDQVEFKKASYNAVYSDKRGFQVSWNSIKPERIKPELKSLVESRLPKGRARIDKTKIKALKEIVNQARKMGIRVVLIEPPEYIEWQKLEDRKYFKNILKPILDDLKVEFISFNYPENELCYDAKYFRDCHHLNKDGAKIWTEQLVKELKKKGYI